MKEWRPLTPAELTRAEEKLRNPPPGSRIEAARRFGVDMTLLIQQLRLSSAERVRRMEEASRTAADIRGAAHRR